MFTENIIFNIIGLFIGSLMLSIYLVPKVKRIVYSKRLMDEPNSRSSHKKSTPSLGGIAFYIIFILGLYFNDQFDEFNVSMSILPGVTLMFFLGLKDDLVALSSRVKFGGQILACLFVLFHYKFEIESFHGFLGIYTMPIWVSIPLALLVMITIINAYNLVDGIDGLAASISTVAFTCFAIYFFWVGRLFLALTAISMIGALVGFLFFNLSERKKIFMGDTGSLVIGFLLAVFSIRLLALEEGLALLPFDAEYIPLVMGTFIFLPLFDVIRVFSVRILQGNSPFSPDRNHIHHILIDKLKWSHRRTSFAISGLSFLIVVCSLGLIIIGVELLGLVLFLLFVVLVLTLILNVWRQWIVVNVEVEINQ